MSNIAYNAKVTMHEAKWTDVDGSTVTFKLPMGGMEGQRNPFEKFTKRRKGRAGTRFAMICYEIQNDSQGPMVYKDEAMLTGWNDSQSNGHTVKFWLCNDGMGHPFDGYERKKDRFVVALVELDDDQETIDQKMRDKVERAKKRPSERPSYVAAMLCKNERFWEWLRSVHDYAVNNEDDARIAMMAILNLVGESRSILDKIEHQERRFHARVRVPFVEWQAEQGDPF